MTEISLNSFKENESPYVELLKKLLIKRRVKEINDKELQSLFIEKVEQKTDLDLTDFKIELEKISDLNIFQKDNIPQDKNEEQVKNVEEDENELQDESVQEVENIEEIESTQGDKGEFQEENTSSEENAQNNEEMMNLINDVISAIMEDESIIQNYDLNNDGILDDDEKLGYFSSIAALDGDDKNITLNEILSSIPIDEADGELKEELIQEQPLADLQLTEPSTSLPSQVANTSNSTSSNMPSHKNTHASNYQEPGGDLATNAKANDVKQRIEQINNEINQKIDKKAQINAQDTEYNKMISNLKALNMTASQSEAKIADFKTQLHNIDYDLTAAQTEIDNISDTIIMKELQSAINSHKSQVQEKINELRAKKTQIETNLSQEQDNLSATNEQIANQEEQISAFEESHPNNEIDKINQEINTLKEEKTSLEQELEQERKEEMKDAQVYGKANAYRQSELVKFMMDYALNPDTKAYYDNMYFNQFKGGAYCAVFSSNVIELMYAKALDDMKLTTEQIKSIMAGSADKNNATQGVTGNQFASSVSSTGVWGQKIQPALNQAGINIQATIDITKMSDKERKNAVRDGKIYPGMAFTYQENGRLHVGFVESINRDLSWNTIEGNTAVTYSDGTKESNTVGAHKRDATNPELSTVTDATVKVLYWMKIMGYSDSQINSLIYSA